jgi:hypothetical protein
VSHLAFFAVALAHQSRTATMACSALVTGLHSSDVTDGVFATDVGKESRNNRVASLSLLYSWRMITVQHNLMPYSGSGCARVG